VEAQYSRSCPQPQGKQNAISGSVFLVEINAMVFGGPRALFPALTLDLFKVGPKGLGLLFAAPGAGALADDRLGWSSAA